MKAPTSQERVGPQDPAVMMTETGQSHFGPGPLHFDDGQCHRSMPPMPVNAW